jgi:hypothetical protein
LALKSRALDNSNMVRRPVQEDRRRRRSSDPLVALHYQLSHARALGSLDTIVIADDSGVVVAGSGAWAACEELAAYAPFLDVAVENTESHSPRVRSLKAETIVKRLSIGSSTVIICAKGSKSSSAQNPDAARSALDRASEGALRILAA